MSTKMTITCLDGQARECERNLAWTGWSYQTFEAGVGTVLVTIPDENIRGRIEVGPPHIAQEYRAWTAHGTVTPLAQREVAAGQWVLLADWNGQFVTWNFTVDPEWSDLIDLYSGNYFDRDLDTATANFTKRVNSRLEATR